MTFLLYICKMQHNVNRCALHRYTRSILQIWLGKRRILFTFKPTKVRVPDHDDATLGKHCLLDLVDCGAGTLDSLSEIKSLLQSAAKVSGATVLGVLHHKFQPQGVSVVCLLAESHISIHTWPERGCATVDMYTCGNSCDPVAACNYIIDKLRPRDYVLTRVARGTQFNESKSHHR